MTSVTLNVNSWACRQAKIPKFGCTCIVFVTRNVLKHIEKDTRNGKKHVLLLRFDICPCAIAVHGIYRMKNIHVLAVNDVLAVMV